MKNNKQGFTLIELLVVIAIIGLLSTLSILALSSARAKARDAKRIADVKQIQTAIEMYYNDTGSYPATTSSLAPGQSITSPSGTVFMQKVPTPPTPVDGSSCPAVGSNGYTYILTGSGASATYGIQYCIGSPVNGLTANTLQTLTSAGF